MQRRAFIIFIKTIFLGVFVEATLFPLHTRSESSSGSGGSGGTSSPPGDPLCRARPRKRRIFFASSTRRFSVIRCYEPASKHPSWAASDLKNDPSHVRRTGVFVLVPGSDPVSLYTLRCVLLGDTILRVAVQETQTRWHLSSSTLDMSVLTSKIYL